MVCMQNRDSSQGIFWTLWRLKRPHTLQCSKLEKREEKSSDDNDQVHFVCEENKFLSHNRITGSQSRVQNMVFCILGANLSSSEHSYLGRGQQFETTAPSLTPHFAIKSLKSLKIIVISLPI